MDACKEKVGRLGFQIYCVHNTKIKETFKIRLDIEKTRDSNDWLKKYSGHAIRFLQF